MLSAPRNLALGLISFGYGISTHPRVPEVPAAKERARGCPDSRPSATRLLFVLPAATVAQPVGHPAPAVVRPPPPLTRVTPFGRPARRWPITVAPAAGAPIAATVHVARPVARITRRIALGIGRVAVASVAQRRRC